jgi:hypothetical protein
MASGLGVLSLVLALALQLRARLWLRLSGLARLDPDSRAQIDVQRLRRRLSLVFYFVAFAFLGGALLVYVRALSPAILFSVCILILAVAFDAIWFLYRHFDRRSYSRESIRSGWVAVFAVNAVFGLFFAISVL